MAKQNPGRPGENESRGFIDAHVHVWTDDLDRYPISTPFVSTDMTPRFARPDAVLDQARKSAVDRVVLVQMSYYGCDNSYMLEVIRRFGGVFRGIAVVDWNHTDPDREMCALAGHGVRGFRIDAEGERAAACLESEGLGKMFRCGQRERQFSTTKSRRYVLCPNILRLKSRFPLSTLLARGVRPTSNWRR
jgi:predicted TIM-barrel fold metal-dependent hydrolase